MLLARNLLASQQACAGSDEQGAIDLNILSSGRYRGQHVFVSLQTPPALFTMQALPAFFSIM